MDQTDGTDYIGQIDEIIRCLCTNVPLDSIVSEIVNNVPMDLLVSLEEGLKKTIVWYRDNK